MSYEKKLRKLNKQLEKAQEQKIKVNKASLKKWRKTNKKRLEEMRLNQLKNQIKKTTISIKKSKPKKITKTTSKLWAKAKRFSKSPKTRSALKATGKGAVNILNAIGSIGEAVLEKPKPKKRTRRKKK
jgi:exonuclease VII large subunit